MRKTQWNCRSQLAGAPVSCPTTGFQISIFSQSTLAQCTALQWHSYSANWTENLNTPALKLFQEPKDSYGAPSYSSYIEEPKKPKKKEKIPCSGYVYANRRSFGKFFVDENISNSTLHLLKIQFHQVQGSWMETRRKMIVGFTKKRIMDLAFKRTANTSMRR